MRSVTAETLVIASIEPDGNRTATVHGTAVDMIGFEVCTVLFVCNTIADGVWTPSVEVSDDQSTWVDPEEITVLGNTVAQADIDWQPLVAATSTIFGYIGDKRYIRASVTKAGGSTGAKFAAFAILQEPKYAP